MKDSDKIRWLRERFDLTRKDLSKRLDISENTIKSIELENMTCSLWFMRAMADAFPEYRLWLFGGDPKDPIEQIDPEIEEVRDRLKPTGTDTESRSE